MMREARGIPTGRYLTVPVAALLPALALLSVALPTLAKPGDEQAGGYESVRSWNAERVREVLASDSVDIIFIGDSWSVPHLPHRPMLTLAREVDFSAWGGLNGLFLSARDAYMGSGNLLRVDTSLSTHRLLGLGSGDYRFVREKYTNPAVYNGIPTGSTIEGAITPATTLTGDAGYFRSTLH